MTQESRWVRWTPVVLLAVVAAAASLWLLQVVAPFLMTLFVAAVLALLVGPAHERIQGFMPRAPWLAALIATLLVVGLIVAPVAGAVVTVAREMAGYVSRWREWSGANAAGGFHPAIESLLAHWSGLVGVDPVELRSMGVEALTAAGQTAYGATATALKNIPWILIKSLIFVLAVFFFFKDGPALMGAWRRLSPLRADHHDLIVGEFGRVCRAVVWGQFLAGLVQAALLVVTLGVIVLVSPMDGGVWIGLLGLAVVVLSMVPFFGATSVWLPTSIVFAAQGFVIEAVVLAVIGASVISTVDNLVKVWVIKDAASLHPLFAFVCVFGGLRTMGIFGVFIGPMLGAVVFALLKVLREEFSLPEQR